MALDYFARQKVDIAVIETGLGGRLDATNVLNPILTLITDISRDHVEILGGSVGIIAREKAGIIKRNVPLVFGRVPDSAEKVIRSVAKRRGAPVRRVRQSRVKIRETSLELDYRGDTFSLAGVRPSLSGLHQLRNAAVVLEAVDLARSRGDLRISRAACAAGLRGTVWPGRFHRVQQDRKPELVLDVAHNEAGMAAFVDTFRRVFPGRRALVLVGFVKRKPHQSMINALSQIAREYAIVPLSNKRTIDVDELVESMNWRGVPSRRFKSIRAGYNYLLKTAGADDIITVVGSHFLVGDFLTMAGQS